MNERIRELFKTIRKYKHTYNLMSNPPQVRYNYTIEEQDIEKFAKLIVRECTDIMYNSMQDTKQSYDLAYHAMLTQLIADINDQFGIGSKEEKFETAFRKKFEGGLDLSGQETP